MTKDTSSESVQKQAKITRFLPARKGKLAGKGKMVGGMVAAGYTDLIESPKPKRLRNGRLVEVEKIDNIISEKSSSERISKERDIQSPRAVRRTVQDRIEPEAEAQKVQINETEKRSVDQIKMERTLSQEIEKNVLSELIQNDHLSNTDLYKVEAVPAYQRFSHLLQEATDSPIDILSSPHLPIPTKYRLLLSLHSALSSACQIAAIRSQRPTWHRLLPALEASTKRTLSIDHVHLINLFLPSAYLLEPCTIVCQGKRVPSWYVEMNDKEFGGHREIKDALHSRILKHVSETHLKFLTDFGIDLPENAQLRNWHPKFDIESVADPMAKSSESEGVKDIPEIIRQAIDAAGNFDHSMVHKSHDEASKNALSSNDHLPTSPIAQSSPNKAKKLSLLERIRLKERQAELDKMIGSSKLVSPPFLDTVDTLSFLFTSHKKSVLLLRDVLDRLKSCGKAVSDSELLERLEKLEKASGGWIAIDKEEKPFTVKIDKRMAVRDVKDRLSKQM